MDAPVRKVEGGQQRVSRITLHYRIKGAEQYDGIKGCLMDCAGHPVDDSGTKGVNRTLRVGSRNKNDGSSELVGTRSEWTILKDTVIRGRGTRV